MKKILPLLLLLTAFAYADTPISWNQLQANIDSWLQGPVQLILTQQEKDVYKKLKTPEEKMGFIKIFWARRDPILRTYENEFKQEFYRRVDYANANFAEGNTPGWKTARGQVYIQFGAPSRIDHQSVDGSSRPGLLWVYDNIPSNKIPKNEALFFVYRDLKYVLLPPTPDPGDTIAAQQREVDSAFRYQSIPSTVQQAFTDMAQRSVFDESKNYQQLLYSVQSTEKFGLAGIEFEIQKTPSGTRISIPVDKAPVYDAANKSFAELYFKQELKQGDKVVASNEHQQSFDWDAQKLGQLKTIDVTLPPLNAPPGSYELSVTVQDRISNVSETRKIQVSY